MFKKLQYLLYKNFLLILIGIQLFSLFYLLISP